MLEFMPKLRLKASMLNMKIAIGYRLMPLAYRTIHGLISPYILKMPKNSTLLAPKN
jgi:hypothetical protein